MCAIWVVKLLIGVLLGFLSGLGIGGGSLLILWLTLAMNADAATARSINLMFFLAAAGSVSLLRLRTGKLDKGAILPAAVCGCIAAGVCSVIGAMLEPTILQKIFGVLLLLTGIRELLYRPRKAK